MSNGLANPLASMPASMIAGDTLKVDFADLVTDYPASAGYAVNVIFVPIAGGAPATIAATGGVVAWSLVAASAATSAWAPGSRRWTVQVALGGEKLTVLSGTIEIQPNPSAADTDSRTHARRVLDALEATIEGRASKSDLKTTFADGRAIERLTHTELLKMRDRYAAIVKAEERQASGRGPARVLARL